ncbi:MAG: hypothetical protein IMY72_06630 [Bacteroidetes bacterium]|nr:hypothetical protein [Bacteroidota bacterium]
MKKSFLTIITLFAVMLVFGQHAKKPTIMVVPSDHFCISHGYKLTFDNQGTKVVLPDYKAALQGDGSLRLVISKLSGIMAERGFPLKDLEQELKSIAQASAERSVMTSKESGASIVESPIDMLKRTAKSDIIMDIDFEVKKRGPQSYVVFTLNGLDAYTSKSVASASGTGRPSSAAAPELLLEEAVLSHMDKFNGMLMTHFKDMFTNGREVKVEINLFEGFLVDLEEEYDYDGETSELGDIIDDWMADNTVEGRYSNSDNTENFIKFEQVRIPMFYDRKGKQRAMDTKKFVNNLRKFLARDPFNLTCKLYQRGLGEAWLIIGEK